ncbi:MAG: rhodanese-like domain-containing protein [Chitinophagaceae bacterium]
MQIKQWEDKNLAQFSYGILSDGEKKLILIDPSRNPQPYLDFSKEKEAEIIGIIETHLHADFVSSHLELHQITGARIYASSMVDAAYPHNTFDEGDSIEFGKIKLSPLSTPGHSPDSITILLEHEGKQKALFTGDTLFIGDCGRPDLREGGENSSNNGTELAKKMYHSLRNKIMTLNDEIVLYPGHGAGSLCGKGISKANSSFIGNEKQSNWSLQTMAEDEFAQTLLSDKPFIPAYFAYNVELNRKGAASFRESIGKINIGDTIEDNVDSSRLNKATWIVDARRQEDYKDGHLPQSINLMEGEKFETWLGSIINPGELFYLAGYSQEQLQRLIGRAAAIGYETQIKDAFILRSATQKEERIDMAIFRENMEDYTIIDVRNAAEIKEVEIFKNSINIPLAELRNTVNDIPTEKPVIVHCAGGYRSAAGSSMLSSALNGKVKVFDMGEAINEFSKK